MDRPEVLPHFRYYLGWCDGMVEMVSQGRHPKVTALCNADTRKDVGNLTARYEHRKDFQHVRAFGENVVSVFSRGYLDA